MDVVSGHEARGLDRPHEQIKRFLVGVERGPPATFVGHWFKEISVPPPDHDPRPEPPLQPAADAGPERTSADVQADAKLYAAMYPDRVTRIRAARGLPPDLDFGPPEPEIVDALLRGAGGAQSVPPRATRSNGAGH